MSQLSNIEAFWQSYLSTLSVDEQFAFEYGEGDRTLAFWLQDNWEFHSQWCRQIGREPSETMPIVFQQLGCWGRVGKGFR